MSASTLSPQAPAESDEAAPLSGPDGAGLLQILIGQPGQAPARADGIAIGQLESCTQEAGPRVAIPAFGLHALPARSLVALEAEHVGQSLALGFESGDPRKPVILGRIIDATAPSPSLPLEVLADGERTVIEAQHEIELRCGEASIVLTADGHILLRGTHITSHASATQRILGGAVNIN